MTCSCATEPLTALSGCEDEALRCLDLVSDGGEKLDYLRGEFCGCLGQACLSVIRDARQDDEAVDPEVCQVMDAARCRRHGGR